MIRQPETKGRRQATIPRLACNRVAPYERAEEGELSKRTQLAPTHRGRIGEDAAATFLMGRGYQVVARNQRTPVGELDLICRDGTEVVIVEVKARQHEEFGAAIEAVGPRKAGRLRAAALWWLSDRGLYPCLVRFDVVLVSTDVRGAPLRLEHVRNVLGGPW